MKFISIIFGFFSFMTIAHAENTTIRFSGTKARQMFHWMSQVPVVASQGTRTRTGIQLRCEERSRKYTCVQEMDDSGTILDQLPYDDQFEIPIEGTEERDVLIRYRGTVAARLHKAMASEHEYEDMKDGVDVLVKYGRGLTCMRPDATSEAFVCEQIFRSTGSMRSTMEFPNTSPIIGSGTHPLAEEFN